MNAVILLAINYHLIFFSFFLFVFCFCDIFIILYCSYRCTNTRALITPLIYPDTVTYNIVCKTTGCFVVVNLTFCALALYFFYLNLFYRHFTCLFIAIAMRCCGRVSDYNNTITIFYPLFDVDLQTFYYTKLYYFYKTYVVHCY